MNAIAWPELHRLQRVSPCNDLWCAFLSVRQCLHDTAVLSSEQHVDLRISGAMQLSWPLRVDDRHARRSERRLYAVMLRLARPIPQLRTTYARGALRPLSEPLRKFVSS